MMKKMLFAPALVFAFISLYSQESLTGNVTDAKSNPIPGASVYILNNNYGTITDAQGKFRLTGLKAGTYIVSISAVGFSGKTEEIITPLKKDFNITLVEANIHLDEVIVSAQKREEVLQKLLQEERTPPETMFLSAQSQMWIFAAYELMRTWR